MITGFSRLLLADSDKNRVKDQRKMEVNIKIRRNLWRRGVYKILSADEARWESVSDLAKRVKV